jgi:hypothetical protein
LREMLGRTSAIVILAAWPGVITVMTAISTLRNRFVDGPGSVGARKRAQRWEWLRETFPDISRMSVIDLGGTGESWQRAPVRPASVHVVNLEPGELGDLPTWIRADQGDACDLPDRILTGHYDLVFSNSVLEHVGGFARRTRFSETVRALADRHWVQTPYRYFPIEPHWLFPGFQFLPPSTRTRIAQWWPLAHIKATSWEDGLQGALSVELISRTEMAWLFPDSMIRYERMAGLVKSLIAVRA